MTHKHKDYNGYRPRQHNPEMHVYIHSLIDRFIHRATCWRARSAKRDEFGHLCRPYNNNWGDDGIDDEPNAYFEKWFHKRISWA